MTVNEIALEVQRGLICIPLGVFLWRQWRSRKQNGIIAAVRWITMGVTTAGLLFILAGFYAHGMVILGKDVHSNAVTVPLLVAYSAVMLISYWVWWRFNRIQDGDSHPPK